MKKTQIITLVIAVMVIIGTFFASSIYDKKKIKISKEIIDKYNELYNNEELSIIYIGRTGCGYCEKYDPIIKEVIEEYKLSYYYIDLSKLTQTDRKNLYETGEVFKDENFGTPTTIIASKKTIIKSHIGYMDKDSLVKFLQETKVIK